MKRRRVEKIGVIGVDAGLCWIGDPCYIIHDKDGNKDLGNSWSEFCERMQGDCRQFNYDLGQPGLGVCVSTAYGDGEYPVYAEFNHEGRVVSVRVDFDSDDEVEGP